MKEHDNIQITIPEGCFEGDCYSCFYAKSKSMKSDGSMLCKEGNRVVFPNDMYGCPKYYGKIKGWLKIGLYTYFVLAVLSVIIEAIF